MTTKKQYYLLNKLILTAAVLTTMSVVYGDTDYYAVLIGINDYRYLNTGEAAGDIIYYRNDLL